MKQQREHEKRRKCVKCPYGCPWFTTNKYRKVPPSNSIVCQTIGKLKDQTKNVYKTHLETCPNRPSMIDDDKLLNEKIDSILARHEKLKAKAKKEASQFVCPYCSKTYTSQNLKHLLACVKKNPEGNEKLKAFFQS